MGPVRLNLTEAQEKRLLERGQAMGFRTLAPYLRKLILDDLGPKPIDQKREVIQAIQALIPTLAAAFGHSNGAKESQIKEFEKLLFDYYDKARYHRA